MAVALSSCVDKAEVGGLSPARVYSRHELTTTRVLSLKQDLRIGAAAENEDYLFNEIADIQLDQVGRIYVLDRQDLAVRVYDANGSFVHKFGRRGRGPGEFISPAAITIGGDTIFVLERSRIQLFDTAGEYIGGLNADLRGIENANHTAAGLFITTRTRFGGSGTQDTLTVRALDLKGMRLGAPILGLAMPAMYGQSGIYLPAPLSPVPRIAIAGDGRSFSTTGDSFHIQVRGAHGTLIVNIVGEVQRLRATASDIKHALEARQRIALSYRGRKISDAVPQPEYRPTLGQLFVDDSGSLLVQRLDLSPSLTSDTVPWDYIDSALELVGRVSIPRRFVIYALAGCSIIGAERGALDVQTVVRYTILGGGHVCQPSVKTN